MQQSAYSRLLIFLLIVTVAFQWKDFDDMRTGSVTLISGGTIFSASNTAISYNISYDGGTLSQTTSAGIGIVGFETYITNYFSVNATIVNFAVDTLRITAIALDDTIVTHFTINYIVVGAEAYFAQVKFDCFLPSTLATGNGTRTETRTDTNLFVNKVLLCNVYLSGFRLENDQGLINYLKAEVTCPANSSGLSYTFTTNQNNTAHQICYTTVVFCEPCTQILYEEWGEIGQNSLSTASTPATITVQNRFESSNRMFFGMSALNISRGIVRLFIMETTTENNLTNNYQTNFGTYEVIMDHFFLSVRGCNKTALQWFDVPTESCVADTSCSADTAQTLGGGSRFCQICHYTCQECTDGSLQENCTACNPTFYRTLVSASGTCPCDSGYIDIGISLCYPCEYYMAGCDACLSTTLCTNCEPGFTLNAAGVCQCTSGSLVTGVCTTEVGCVSATNLGGTIYCLSCNSTLYRTVNNYSCECMTGYSTDYLGVCTNICGDSSTVTTEGCDDGNTVSGDGCSSVCAVETGYSCTTTSTPSVCIVSTTVTAEVKYVRRTLSSNQVQFGIYLDPYFSLYQNTNFNSAWTTDLSCSSYSVIYQNKLLKYFCDYTKTIESLTYSLNFTLDSNYFNNMTVSMTLPASGMNAKLTYDSQGHNQMVSNLSVVVIVLSALAIGILFLSMVSERMIGVEMMHTLQTVLYTMTLMGVAPSTLAPLQNLQYTNGFNSIRGVDHARVYTYDHAISSVGIQKQFLLSYNLGLIVVVVTIVTALALKLIINYQQASHLKNNKQIPISQTYPKHSSIKKGYNFIFERLIFVMAFMWMFLIIFAAAIQFTDMKADYDVVEREFNLLFAGIAVMLLITFLTMVVINGVYPITNIFPMFMAKNYPIYYVVYNTTLIMLVSTVYTQSWLLYALIAMVFLNFIVLVMYRPYPTNLDNNTLLFNQIIIALALFTYIYQITSTYTDNHQTIYSAAVILLVVMMFVCVLLATIRLYYFYKFMEKNQLSYEKNEEKDLDDYEELKTPKNKMSPYQAYLQDVKVANSKSPLNNSFSRQKTVRRRSSNNNDQQKQKEQKQRAQEEDNYNSQYSSNSASSNSANFDTFNKEKQDKKMTNRIKDNEFQLQKIDPNPRIIPANTYDSPYNEYGQAKRNNQYQSGDDDSEFDALKVIKARLRKDFYSKINGKGKQFSNEPSIVYSDAFQMGNTPGAQYD